MKQITKEIKGYLHLYLGCDVYVFPDETYTNGWLTNQLKSMPDLEYSIPVRHENVKHILERGYKPLLRKLSSMTEEEKEKLFDSVFPEGWMTRSINWAGKIDFINYYLNLEAVNNSGLFDQIIISMDFKHHIKMVNWVRENKFDADELIDSGLALDKENKH